MNRRAHLLGPEQISYIDREPVLYVDNYMVRGYKREHSALGGPRNVPLNLGLEKVRQGIVLADRPIAPSYLSYLNRLNLFDPTSVVIEPVRGSAATMMLRVLESPDDASRIAEQVRAKRIKYIDTFGISEVIGRIATRESHRRFAERFGLPIFYNSNVADLVRSKSTARQLVGEWVEPSELNGELLVPRGINNLTLESLRARDLRHLMGDTQPSRIVIKKDISTFNKGNAFIRADDLSAHLGSDQALRVFVTRACSFLDKNTEFCVEEFIEHHSAPSALLRIDPNGHVELQSLQEQVYSGGVLLGFRHPPRIARAVMDKLERACFMIGHGLYALGYIGHAVPDFLVTADGVLYFMEINMRRGGCSIGSDIVARLNGGSLAGLSYETSLLRFDPTVHWSNVENRLRSLAFDRGTRRGAVLAEGGRFAETGLCTLIVITPLGGERDDEGRDLPSLVRETRRACAGLPQRL